MNTRLKQFMAAENITQSQLADSLKVVRASVSHILSGRNNPSYDFIKALMARYPRLNMEWLMFGKGRMYKDDVTLFPSEEMAAPSSDGLETATEHDSSPENKPDGNTASLFDIDTLYARVQNPVNQRKVVKVTILFDDGTYQEL